MPDGGTLKLSSDISSDGTLTIDKKMTIALDGRTLSYTGKDTALHVQGGSLTISGDGTITGSPSVQLIGVSAGGTLTILDGTFEAKTGSCVFVMGNRNAASEATVPSKVEVLGGYVIGREYGIGVEGIGASVVVKGGTVEAVDNAAIGGNGTSSATKYCGGTFITLDGATVISSIKSKGYIACGVYHPQQGTLTVRNSNILANGGVGILMRGGVLNIKDSEITTTGTASGKVGDSKVIGGCYGICVDAESGYYDAANIHCTIADTTVSTVSNSVQAIPEDETTIGMFDIISGVFSTDPTIYAKDRSVIEEDGKYKVA